MKSTSIDRSRRVKSEVINRGQTSRCCVDVGGDRGVRFGCGGTNPAIGLHGREWIHQRANAYLRATRGDIPGGRRLSRGVVQRLVQWARQKAFRAYHAREGW